VKTNNEIQPNDTRTTEPLVSCIIIYFNAEEHGFLGEAIESVLSQSYSNWELLLCNDGSTDNSEVTAQKYAQLYPDRISLHNHSNKANRGMSATRNLGIENSRGKYVAFLDSDDIWLPNKLKEQTEIMETHKEVGMVYGKTLFWFSWSKLNPCYFGNKKNKEQEDLLTVTSFEFNKTIEPPKQLIDHIRYPEIYPCTCSMFVRSDVFSKIGAFENTFKDAQEDQVFNSKLFLHYPVYVSSKCWDKYRIHPSSFWRKKKTEGREHETVYKGRKKYLDWLYQYLHQENLSNLAISTALAKERHKYETFRRYQRHIFHKQLKSNIANLLPDVLRNALIRRKQNSISQ